MLLISSLSVALSLFNPAPSPVAGAPVVQKDMRLGGRVIAPIGYLQFCERRPDQCGLQSAAASRRDLEASLQAGRAAQTLALANPSHEKAGEGTFAADEVPKSYTQSSTPIASSSSMALTLAEVSRPAETSSPQATPMLRSGPGVFTRASLSGAASATPVLKITAASDFFKADAALAPVVTGADAILFRHEVFALNVAKGADEAHACRAVADRAFVRHVSPVVTLASFHFTRPAISPTPASVQAAPALAANVTVQSMSSAFASDRHVIGLTARTWALLQTVNGSINQRIQPMSDEQAFGVSNYWALPLSDGPHPYGNCKHYALEKRKALVDAGVPAETLSLAIVRTYNGDLHAVLLVATDRGELVLDNLDRDIRGWSEPHYRWLARQTPGQPLNWVSVLSGVS